MRMRASLLAALTAALLGAAGTGAAFATTYSPGGAFAATSTEDIVFTTGIGDITCSALVLRGTLERSIVSPSVDAGEVTDADLSGCTAHPFPTASVAFTGLPWPIDFLSADIGTNSAANAFAGAEVQVLGHPLLGSSCVFGDDFYTEFSGADFYLGYLVPWRIAGPYTCGSTMTIETGLFVLSPVTTVGL